MKTTTSASTLVLIFSAICFSSANASKDAAASSNTKSLRGLSKGGKDDNSSMTSIDTEVSSTTSTKSFYLYNKISTDLFVSKINLFEGSIAVNGNTFTAPANYAVLALPGLSSSNPTGSAMLTTINENTDATFVMRPSMTNSQGQNVDNPAYRSESKLNYLIVKVKSYTTSTNTTSYFWQGTLPSDFETTVANEDLTKTCFVDKDFGVPYNQYYNAEYCFSGLVETVLCPSDNQQVYNVCVQTPE